MPSRGPCGARNVFADQREALGVHRRDRRAGDEVTLFERVDQFELESAVLHVDVQADVHELRFGEMVERCLEREQRRVFACFRIAGIVGDDELPVLRAAAHLVGVAQNVELDHVDAEIACDFEAGDRVACFDGVRAFMTDALHAAQHKAKRRILACRLVLKVRKLRFCL